MGNIPIRRIKHAKDAETGSRAERTNHTLGRKRAGARKWRHARATVHRLAKRTGAQLGKWYNSINAPDVKVNMKGIRWAGILLVAIVLALDLARWKGRGHWGNAYRALPSCRVGRPLAREYSAQGRTGKGELTGKPVALAARGGWLGEQACEQQTKTIDALLGQSLAESTRKLYVGAFEKWETYRSSQAKGAYLSSDPSCLGEEGIRCWPSRLCIWGHGEGPRDGSDLYYGNRQLP